MKKILKTLTLILPTLALIACGEGKDETSSTNENETFTPVELKSCGSTSVDKVITALGSKFASLTGNKVTLKKNQTGSGDATVGVTTGKNNTKYDIGFLSREIKANEKATLTDENKNGTMCKDAVVPIVNSNNAYSSTDKATLTAIYKGEKTAWNELDANLSGNIKLYSRESGSGTRECFFEGIGYGEVKVEDKFVVEVSKQSSNGDMMRAIKDDKYGIGYCSLDSLSSASGIKGLAFEGVMASIDTVNDGTYTLSRNFNYVIRGDYEENDNRKMAVNAFVDFMSSKEGLASIQTAGGIISGLDKAPTWSSIQVSKYPLLAK